MAEATTTEISKKQKPKTFTQNKTVAQKGGQIAGNTRKEIEEQTKERIVSPKNEKSLIDKSDNQKLKE